MKGLGIKTMLLVVLSCFLHYTESVNKYSSEANKPTLNLETPTDFRALDKPFRMAKLNMLWSKAQLRLTEPKLKSLFSDLKIHDKEEITWKRLKSEGHDKDGVKEAQLRKKLLNLMNTYGLLEYFEETNDQEKVKSHVMQEKIPPSYLNKSLFKDKKLNQLWAKAEVAGFTADELRALKEEFEHHQDKIDQYYSLLEKVEKKDDGDNAENSVDDKLDRFNTLETLEDENQRYENKANSLRSMHQQLRDGYDRLYRVAAKGPNSKEFIEPKVQGLWRMALEANFSPDELESLRTELLHYENRLLKLRHLHAEAELNGNTVPKMAGTKPTNDQILMDDTIKKHSRKVEKLHLDLETKIMQKHIEL